eukprot:jgi/Bigna1/74364/fgenesh1_pg.28_\
MIRLAVRLLRLQPKKLLAATGTTLTVAATGLWRSNNNNNYAQAEMKKTALDMRGLLPGDVLGVKKDLHAFSRYSDKQGNMSLTQFARAMRELGVTDDSVVQSFFNTLDTNDNGKVSFEEFVAGIAAIGSDTAEPKSRLNFVFQSCDLSGDGVVEKDELRKMIHALLVTRENLWTYKQIKMNAEMMADKEMNLFDEWHRAILVRVNDDDDGFDDYMQTAQKERLNEIYSDDFSSHIMSHADTNKDTKITYNEFQTWATKESKDAKFLFDLYKGFQIVEPLQQVKEDQDERTNLWCL